MRICASLQPILGLVGGLCITAVLFFWIHHYEQDLEDADFEQGARAHVAAVRNELEDAVRALQIVTQLFKTPAPVSREQFLAFTQPFLTRYPYIQSFSLQRLDADRAAQDGAHVPLFAGQETAFGMEPDAFVSGASAAMQRARATGLASSTGLFEIAPGANARRGFALVMPVYRYSTALAAPVRRHPALAGYTVVAIRAGDLLEEALAKAELLNADRFDISIYAGDSPGERDLAYRTRRAMLRSQSPLQLPEQFFHDRPSTFFHRFDFAGRTWRMVVSAQPVPLVKKHLGSLLVLFAGAVASLLAAAYLRTVSTRSRRIQRLIVGRTAQLKRANERLIKDIAAREQAEKALRHTQHILTSAQKIANMGSWELDAKTGELHCSDEYFRVCGLEPQSIKPTLKFTTGIVHPDDLPTTKKTVAAVRAGQRWFRDERRIIRPDGSIRHVVSQGEAIFDENQELQRVIGTFMDVTERKEAEFALRQSQEKLRELAAHQERIREDERKRIAREVHDELGSVLTGIKAHLSVAIERAAAAGAPADQLLVDASELVDVATDTVRRVITDLRPSVLDQLGVWAALEWYAGQTEKRSGLVCECAISETVAAIELDPERSIVLFRIVQEALTNAVRHAGASQVTIRARRQASVIVVEVEDNGKGIGDQSCLERPSWGIIGMHERARYVGGECSIVGAMGLGTKVALKLPIEDSHG